MGITEQAPSGFEFRGAPAEIAVEARPRPRGDGRDGVLATGLGWFSVGLGVAEVVAPGLMTRAIGVGDNADNRELMRAAGLREIASGVGILTRDRQAGWMWARVGGDAMDLALLGLGFTSDQARPNRLAAATAAVAGITALDVICGRRLGNGTAGAHLEHVTRAITVNRPPADVYQFWRDFENLPKFMRHVKSVEALSPTRSHWSVAGPLGTTVEWDAEIAGERRDELISWRSLPGAEVENTGLVQVKAAPGGRGTEVIVRIDYAPPAGDVGVGLAWLLGEEPGQQLQEDLRRFKQVMETGEIARTAASESWLGMGRPARPARMEPYSDFARGER